MMQGINHSIIEYYSENDGYKCGYCKRPNSNYSHGMWVHTMTVDDYQDLIDRGWRRSGKYCYKPVLEVICCPMYTIRCRALEFKLTKSQKKVLKRLNKYLMGQDEIFQDRIMSSSSMETEGREIFVENHRGHQDINIRNINIPLFGKPEFCNNEQTLETLLPEEQQKQISFNSNQSEPKCNVVGPDPMKQPCKKAKQARRERMLEKLRKKGIDIGKINTTNENKEKQVEDFINELPNDVRRTLEQKEVLHHVEYHSTLELVEQNQCRVTLDIGVERVKIKLVRTSPPSQEWMITSHETFKLYVKYQTVVHGDKPEKCTESQFSAFLVRSPLLEEHLADGPPCGYGSFHQQYWLDGKLIAVGVIDILPKCISSVYFFYDPDHMNLNLGTYGALREIAFTRHMHTISPEIKYYYMGFYIHSCIKMRYKGNFQPSDLLCPETYKWFPLKDCIPKLEASPYSRLDPDIDSIDEDCIRDSDLNNIPVLWGGEVMTYAVYRRRANNRCDNWSLMMEYAQLIGAKTAKRLIMVQ